MSSIETQVIHSGRPEPRIGGAVVTPIFQASTYEYHGEAYHDVGYMRLSNTPNHRVLADRLAAIEQAEAAIVTGSGMAAVTSTLFALLKHGDHILVQDCIYGGTRSLLTDELERFGVSHTTIDIDAVDSWEAALTESTRAIYVETLSNPLVQVTDLEAVSRFAAAHNLIAIVDNTFASPVLCSPASFGFDVVIESCTKYLGGHNDLIGGCVAGRADLVARIKRTLDHFGGHLDTNSCFLLERGSKTLPLRVARQGESAMQIAQALSQEPAVKIVHYPGLPHHPHYERAKRLLRGFGSILSFELHGGTQDAEAFLEALRIPVVAASSGGAESLIVRPAAASHSGLASEERARAGIADGLIRFSVGLENAQDLIEDLRAALATVAR